MEWKIKNTIAAIALIGATVVVPFAISFAAVAAIGDDHGAAYLVGETGSRYRGPENFWSD